MVSRREWLSTQIGSSGAPLAKAGARGKFSHEAQQKLAEAIAQGMTFDDASPTSPAPSTRRSAAPTAATGPVQPERVAPSPEPATPARRVIPPAKPRVRPEDEAWLMSLPPEDKPYLNSHPISFDKCAKCNQRIGFCSCVGGPVGPKWVNGVDGEPLLLSKP